MATIRQKLVNKAAGIYFKKIGLVPTEEELANGLEGETTAKTSALLRRAAAESAVLLENDGTLPLTSGKVALFGRAQIDTFFTGYGSGGNVLTPYRVNILDGIRASGLGVCEDLAKTYEDYCKTHKLNYSGWGEWPHAAPEMPLYDALVRAAREETDTAVVVIGRAAGEDSDIELRRGSYYLSGEERRMLTIVTDIFPRVTVVLNIGNIMDLGWMKEYDLSAVLLAYQGGMEAGNAVADVITGKVNPCGKLADTVAARYRDYPSASKFGNPAVTEYMEDIYVGYRHFETFAPDSVLYPFGYGKSYTTFALAAEYTNGRVRYRVRNTGRLAGREVIQLYVQKPQNGFGNPARELIAFHKTALLPPGGEERGEFVISDRAFSSYQEEQISYIMSAGEYGIYVGTDVRSAERIGTFTLAKDRVTEALSSQCTPRTALTVRTGEGGFVTYASRQKQYLRTEIEGQLPALLPKSKDKSCTFNDVLDGKASLKSFVAHLEADDLEALAYGALRMNSPLGTPGNAGVLGGVTTSLMDKGVPPLTAADGPSGIRLKKRCSLLPSGALLACSFDPELVQEVYAALGEEMRDRGVHILLGPALNIHRNPLCGRNFEYYSDDPFLTGKIAAAAVRGLQSASVSACPKHFACNNQETGRAKNDSRVTERALREIYLYGFELCVKEGQPHFLMTSYNKINGVWSYYNYELVRGILRKEWGFDGCVMTDWWTKSGKSTEFPKLKNNALRVRAGVNVLMPGGGFLGKKKHHGGLLSGLDEPGRLTLAELQQNACEVLSALVKNGARIVPAEEPKEG